MQADDGAEAQWLDPIVVPIEDALDLHTFRPQEILEIVDAYIEAAIEKGFEEVRLIHGRGKGVQRARVQQWLDRDPRVLRWQEAPPGRGGWGATLAWLDVEHGPDGVVDQRGSADIER